MERVAYHRRLAPLHHAAVWVGPTGSVIGLVGAIGWELVEILLGINQALPDTISDVVLGVGGGALGAWTADRYLDRLFNRSRSSSR